MMFITIISTAAILSSALAIPTEVTYGPPLGGWESINYPAGIGKISLTTQHHLEGGKTSNLEYHTA
jgi:hypothetical protein